MNPKLIKLKNELSAKYANSIRVDVLRKAAKASFELGFMSAIKLNQERNKPLLKCVLKCEGAAQIAVNDGVIDAKEQLKKCKDALSKWRGNE